MKKQLILCSIYFMMLSLIACSKGENGDIGPAGSVGAKGAKGPTGDLGIVDAKGMISSSWLAVKGSDWRASSSANSYFVSFVLPNITADIINKGMLYVYWKPETTTNAGWALPYFSASTGLRFYSLVVMSNNEAIIQFYQTVTPPSSTFSTANNVSFRFVFVPASAGARMSNVDWTNYEEAKKVLNWKD